ncbi:MAG: CocE/NonD family hydrolase [Rhizobiales bacterium]|nr:CocE/NonD family hydrolase [Hyphomicrobiales bacterium]
MFPGLEPPDLEVVHDFPHEITETETEWIPMPDGVRLAARIWRPAGSDSEPAPAVLEYIPYRRRDARLADDERIHPWFAGHGIAGIRVDIRGTGDSDGLLQDEYLKLELDDAIAVIHWIAEQSWCDGNVGMMGLSWGGFNSLQVAARNPAPLKAIIAVGATVDRYNDDIHYKNGCLLNENFGWAASLMAFSTRPPDPDVVGRGWREIWRKRLENLPFYAENWFAHQTRDEYWKHGSVCEDYADIKCPVMIVAGWSDLYVNALPRLLENLQVPCRAIAGPWAHQYPHLASPGPLIDFMGEATRWWQRWLVDDAPEQTDERSYLGFVQHGAPPDPFAQTVPGHWLEASRWPCPNVEVMTIFLGDESRSEDAQFSDTQIHSPLDTGTSYGELVPHCSGPEMPLDQRSDDGCSVIYETSPLPDALDIWGDPAFEAQISSSAPDGNLIVRLCDVSPDGFSQRVSVGVLNLRHLCGNGNPEPCPVGTPVFCRIGLDHVAHRFPAGHKIRISLSTACWPAIWPAKNDPVLSLVNSLAKLDLPVVDEGEHVKQVQPAGPAAPPPIIVKTPRQPRNERRITRDEVARRTVLDIRDDYGKVEFANHGMMNDGVKWERYTISDGDPLSATCDIGWTLALGRSGWLAQTKTTTRLTCDETHYHLHATVTAIDGDLEIFSRSWRKSIKRQ